MAQARRLLRPCCSLPPHRTSLPARSSLWMEDWGWDREARSRTSADSRAVAPSHSALPGRLSVTACFLYGDASIMNIRGMGHSRRSYLLAVILIVGVVVLSSMCLAQQGPEDGGHEIQ